MGEQPIFTTQAHVFQIDPETKRSWLPVSKLAVPVSYYIDTTKNSYRIVAIDGSKVIINSVVLPGMVFTKTSQKFGQWSEAKSSTVYGLGFSSEQELSKFEDKFNEIKLANNKVSSSGVTYENLPSPTSTSVSRQSSMLSTKSGKVNGHSGTGSIRSVSSASSYEDDTASASDSHRSLNGSSESQLKYENDRLKKALAQSSANAKKWEAELQTLKNNNARLTAALQESTVNVEKWKEQLNNYKEENTKLRRKVTDGESSSNQNNSRVETLERRKGEAEKKALELESRLTRRDEEVNKLAEQLRDHATIKETNSDLSSQIQQLQNEVRQLRQLNSQLEGKVKNSDKHSTAMAQCGDITQQMQTKLRELIGMNDQIKALVFT